MTTAHRTQHQRLGTSERALTGGLGVKLRSNWATTFSGHGLRRTLIHEITHYLGLGNYTNTPQCTSSTAAMNDSFACEFETTMDDFTINDYLPVTKTVYGTSPRTSCGF